jgi:two-component system sensor histidine kinase UhpB
MSHTDPIVAGAAFRTPLDSAAKCRVSAQPGVGAWTAARLRWHGRPLWLQLVILFVAIELVAGGAAALVLVVNARGATEVEMTAAVDLAERYVRTRADQLEAASAGGLLPEDLLALPDASLRHLRVLVASAAGRPIWLLPANGERASHGASAPGWFAAMVRPTQIQRSVPISSAGFHIGTIILAGESGDEIAEVWRDFSGLAVIAVSLGAAAFVLFYAAARRVLQPLSAVASGLDQLQRGHFRHRLERPSVGELAILADRFNGLAHALQTAEADNRRLSRRLLTLQDDERRHIAAELHDELGPCLFGIRANVGSLLQMAQSLPEREAGALRERATAALEIVGALQDANRRLLKRMRPMALGHASLTQLIAGLVAEFRRHASHPTLSVDLGRLRRSYGETLDLTVYRCIQEGITNAFRHADARTVSVGCQEQGMETRGARPEGGSRIFLAVRDDGHGFTPGTRNGLGLRGIEERVRALGGSFELTTGRGGSELLIELPLGPGEPACP